MNGAMTYMEINQIISMEIYLVAGAVILALLKGVNLGIRNSIFLTPNSHNNKNYLIKTPQIISSSSE